MPGKPGAGLGSSSDVGSSNAAQLRASTYVDGYVLEPGLPTPGLDNSADTVTLTRCEVAASNAAQPTSATPDAPKPQHHAAHVQQPQAQ